MSRLQRAIQYVLEQDWPDTSPFEAPEVVRGKESIKELKGTNDVAKVVEQTDPNAEPAGFRHTYEDVDESVVVQIWTVTRRVDGIEQRGGTRLFGEFDTPEDAAIGGLAAEVRSLLQDRRLGFGPYDYVDVSWPINNSDMAGKNEWRADIQVEAGEYARQL